METTLLSRHELKVDLQAGLQRNEFVVHYQPIVELATGEIKWFEALVRWNHPSRGTIGPVVFIPLAEETGAILELGHRVLVAACHQAARWKEAEPRHSDLRMSVNISAKQLQHPELVQEVATALAQSGLNAGSLVLEITENAMIEDTQATLTQFRRLKELGVRIAIDDFGTGYSSLSWLRRFPVDILKIAKPFIDGLSNNPGDMAFLQAISDLGRTLDLEMVAEGIERPAQVEQLRKLNLTLGQGFFYAMPLASQGAKSLLDESPLGVEMALV
jgi:EAL domain-containing protein (putative c-di-GMP-specific phosphodiesterase class I)